MKKIIEASDLPNDEHVFLKKDMFGWRVVEPIRGEDGKLKFSVLIFGGYKNLAILIMLLLLAGLVYIGTLELISNYKQVAENPCAFCTDCHDQTRDVLDKMNKEGRYINYSVVNFSLGG